MMTDDRIEVALHSAELERRLLGEALGEACAAADQGEVPVGAVVFHEGRIVGRGSNSPITRCDPTAHAEMLAIREAASRIGNYRLPGAILAVTLEPCLMCFGAALHARLARVVFGASDPRVGAADLVERLQSKPGVLNHRLIIDGGIRKEECGALLRGFFAERR
jgi:tRNA(adenine34) deaminase